MGAITLTAFLGAHALVWTLGGALALFCHKNENKFAE